MANKKGTKETKLFNGRRRKILIKGGALVWLDAKDKKHTRLKIRMPLTGENVVGMPSFLGDAYTSMQKDNSADDFHSYDVYMEGIAVDLFSTDKIKSKIVRLTGCELEKFHIEKSGMGDKAVVSLHFELDVLGHKQLYDEMWELHNSQAYAEFDYNQADIPFEKATPKEEESDADSKERKRQENEKIEKAKANLKLM